MADPTLLTIPTRFALDRMVERGLNEGQIHYAIQHHEHEYSVGKQVVYRSTLPDGKRIKVRIEEVGIAELGKEGSVRLVRIVDVFTHV